MILFPNAKINVGHKIGDLRSDGYHEIKSTIYPIEVFDILEILPADQFVFQSSGIKIDDKDNLVIKAFELLKREHNIGNVFIHLHKQIPLGAGLGGGSSDASFCLKGLNTLFDLGLNKIELSYLALKLGSDCPFFIHNTPSKVEGRGEIINESPNKLSGKWIKLIYPDIHISTAEAFENFRKDPAEIDELNLNEITTNDFENWALKEYPILNNLKHQLVNEGAYFSSLTGSGSTIYGLYHKPPVNSTDFKFEKILQLK